MITLSDIKVEGSTFEHSLLKLTGVRVADIYGYIASEWGDPFFLITSIMLENGVKMNIEGEHDIPYLTPDDNVPNFDYDTLERLDEEEEE